MVSFWKQKPSMKRNASGELCAVRVLLHFVSLSRYFHHPFEISIHMSLHNFEFTTSQRSMFFCFNRRYLAKHLGLIDDAVTSQNTHSQELGEATHCNQSTRARALGCQHQVNFLKIIRGCIQHSSQWNPFLSRTLVVWMRREIPFKWCSKSFWTTWFLTVVFEMHWQIFHLHSFYFLSLGSANANVCGDTVRWMCECMRILHCDAVAAYLDEVPIFFEKLVNLSQRTTRFDYKLLFIVILVHVVPC